jgi:hypothetical protein
MEPRVHGGLWFGGPLLVPENRPSQLTPTEVADIKDMVLAPEHRHMPLGTLARYAQRIGKVFSSASTWAKLVREHGWRRPRQRVHPPKPTVGVRASHTVMPKRSRASRPILSTQSTSKP